MDFSQFDPETVRKMWEMLPPQAKTEDDLWYALTGEVTQHRQQQPGFQWRGKASPKELQGLQDAFKQYGGDQ